MTEVVTLTVMKLVETIMGCVSIKCRMKILKLSQQNYLNNIGIARYSYFPFVVPSDGAILAFI